MTTDRLLNDFLAYGTHAQRLAFTPSPPIPASGPSPAYVWYETDTGLEYTYAAAAWHLTGSTGIGNVSGPGSSTDRAIATWNSTSGILLRDNSTATVNSAGNITGTNLITGGNVSATGNISGANIGNITPVNLDGNGSHVLLGNGTWGTASGGGALSLISEVTTSSSQGNVTFSSISSSYRDLYIRILGRGTSSDSEHSLYMQFNSDTGSNYNMQRVFGFGSSGYYADEFISSTEFNLGGIIGDTATANFSAMMTINIPCYSLNTYFKTIQAEWIYNRSDTSTQTVRGQSGGIWKDTTTVSTIKIYHSTGNWKDGSVVSLYGSS